MPILLVTERKESFAVGKSKNSFKPKTKAFFQPETGFWMKEDFINKK
jgi:hypothetical protein